MTARFCWNQWNTRGHRPRLQWEATPKKERNVTYKNRAEADDVELFGTSTIFTSQRWFAAPRLLSIGIHVLILILCLLPWTSTLPAWPKLRETRIVLYTPFDVLYAPRPV